MRRLLILALLPLASCAGTWPTQPYVQMSADADATALAPALTDCTAQIVPPQSVVSLPTSTSPLSAVLVDDLTRSGLLVQVSGVPLAYVAASIDQGEYVRVATAHAACSQYLTRSGGTLVPAGPEMVVSRE